MLIDEVLPAVVGGRAPLARVFVDEGSAQGVEESLARTLFAEFPSRLRRADCFYDKLVKLWRYEFGAPFHCGYGRRLLGPHVWPEVRHLVRVAKLARALLTPLQRQDFLQRLNIPEKHPHALAEFLPVLSLSLGTAAEFEFRTGAGKRDVEWRLAPSVGRPILIEVKHRIRDIIELGTRMMAGERMGDGRAPQPSHDADLLFRSVERKFLENDPAVQIQGVWIDTPLKQEESELAQAFERLDGERVHFAILGGWQGSVQSIARPDVDTARVLETIGRVHEPGSFAFRRLHQGATDGRQP